MHRYLQVLYNHAKTIKRDIWSDSINSGNKLKLTRDYFRWNLFYKFKNRSWQIQFENGMKSIVYPYPDHDAGELNIWSKNVDFHDLKFIRRHLKRGDKIIDAGCNVGNRTLAIADLIDGALLIDAGAAAIKRTKENLALNGLDNEKFKVIHCAVGDQEGEVHFTDLGGASTLNMITNDPSAKTVKVSIKTIDNLARENNVSPAFIKIDVEGYDFAAIRGSQEIIKSGSVRLIKFEHLPNEPVEPIRDFFRTLGWTVFALNNNGFPDTKMALLQENLNLFAMPDDYYTKEVQHG